MHLLLPFDTETTGIPDWKIPSEDPSQPHILEIGAQLVDLDSREVVEEMSVLVRPDGWEISKEITEITGITFEMAMDTGISEPEALEQFMAMYDKCALRTAFNATFDNRIIRIAQKRYGIIEDVMEAWKTEKHGYYCAMINSRKAIGGKQPSLGEAYKHFFGKAFEGSHRALPDAIATKEIYFALKDIGQA